MKYSIGDDGTLTIIEDDEEPSPKPGRDPEPHEPSPIRHGSLTGLSHRVRTWCVVLAVVLGALIVRSNHLAGVRLGDYLERIGDNLAACWELVDPLYTLRVIFSTATLNHALELLEGWWAVFWSLAGGPLGWLWRALNSFLTWAWSLLVSLLGWLWGLVRGLLGWLWGALTGLLGV